MREPSVKEIVRWMISEGLKNTSSGNWIFYGKELTTRFGLSKDWAADKRFAILHEAYSCQEVESLDVFYIKHDEDWALDFTFYDDFCPNLAPIERMSGLHL